MALAVSLLATLVFGFFGVIGFYHAFKRYNSDDNFLDIMSACPNLLQIVGEVFLWMTKKLFPHWIHSKIYRAAAFLFGLMMFGIVSLLW
ncbi:hypothetical protein [Halobacillus sp. A5]|uniref:hypothetical protein n=1 Tax=Halobacillus sp. A5 TaxID=2880263 RepID=UPI0020A65733|nr:hypothetical protein [Halobacillus sp. A5]MCP3027623.1 hypothetical protein [Halobacillus sp. A5]